MPSINNDQNIDRRFPKMSEGFHDENNANLSKSIKTVALFEEINSIEENLSDEEINVIDHMYSSNADNEEQVVSTPSLSCQTAESEVKLIKDWLILHTDLIQQQNDDIIDRDREIYILRKENEMVSTQNHSQHINKQIILSSSRNTFLNSPISIAAQEANLLFGKRNPLPTLQSVFSKTDRRFTRSHF